MKNKVYYGEYSLKHWIELILSKDLTLPEYQRSFVWEKDDVKSLIESLKNDCFVLPVTIGHYDNKNLILDGQQRLTSILLAYLNSFPKKDSFKFDENERINYANESDVFDEKDEETSIIKWTFERLLNDVKNPKNIKDEIKDSSNYEKLDFATDDEFFAKKYLGFSYIVPVSNEISEQQKMYSSVFRNINSSGKKLSNQESRRSLYFMNPNLTIIFEPDFVKDISVNSRDFDFVRCLTFISQYSKNGFDSVGKGYKNKFEDLYEKFIESVIQNETEKTQYLNDFNLSFMIGDFKSKFENLNSSFKKLNLKKSYKNTIESDIYMFGFICVGLYSGKQFVFESAKELNTELEKLYETEKNNKDLTLTNLRSRLSKSVKVYEKYVK